MEFGTIMSLIISVVGFCITIATISRKMITKDDIKSIEHKLDDLAERNTNTEKQIAVMEYKIEVIEKKVGI